MSHEFSIFILIAAALLILALVCGVIFFGVSQSRDIADRGQTTIADTVSLTDVIMSVQRKPNMPAAAAYTILKEHPELF
jgi:flagellar basal body-associated protein FliL